MFIRTLATGVFLLTTVAAQAQFAAVVSDPASAVGYSSAQLNAHVTPGASAVTLSFQWGTTTSYGNTRSAVPGSAQPGATVGFSNAIGGLSPTTTYHYRAVATSTDTTVYGADVTFTTATSGAPDLGSSGIIHGGNDLFARIYADINPSNSPTTVALEYGTSTAYGQAGVVSPASLPAGIYYVPVSCSLSALQRNEVYHYRWVLRNGVGTTTGGDRFFTTSNVGIGSPAKNELHIYPNPTTNNLIIDVPTAATDYTVRITDLMGKSVPVPAISIGQQYQLDLSALAYGAYHVSVTNQAGTISQIVIKQ